MRWALCMGLALACVPTEPDGIGRAIAHAMEPGDRLGGAPGTRGAAPGALDAGDARDATLWTTSASGEPPADPAGWEPLWRTPDEVLWRRQTVAEAPAVSVQLDGLPGPNLDHAPMDPLRGWVQHGPASPGAELVVTAFLQPPAFMPRRPCLSLELADRRLALGTLLQGRGGFIPGAGPRPVVRHRARIPLGSVPTGEHMASLHLHQCGSDFAYAPPSTVKVQVSASGRPTPEQLAERLGTPDPEAAWAPARGRRYALRRKADGSIEEVAAPPLPRVERGSAFGLLILPPLKLGPWGAPDGTVGPLTALGPLLDEADAALVYLDASASMQGRAPDDRPVHRVRPEVLGHLAEVDVQGIILGSAPRAVEGDRTAQNAAVLGLQVDRVNVGDNENAVGVVVAVSEGPGPPSRDGIPDDVLALGVIEDGGEDPITAARSLAEAGFDGGWVGGESLGPVILHEGVPVIAGLPPMRAVGTSLAMRWYVAPTGVLRVDLVGLEGKGGRWSRVRDDGVKAELEAAASQSYAHDVRLAVGQQVAGVNVEHHGRRTRTPAGLLELPALERGALPAAELPPRCRLTGEAPPASEAIAVGEDLVLRRARVIDAEAGPNDPVQVELVWEPTGALPPGRMQWYVAGHPGTWRDSTAPCDGLWPFHDFVPGTLIRDVVQLYPPAGLVRGEGTLQLGLRLGEERPQLRGARFLDLGPVQVDGPAPETPSAPPKPLDTPPE